MEEVIKMLPRYRVPVVKKSGSKKKTHEEYVAEVAIKNSNIQVVGRYVNANTKIKHRCLIDEYEWEASPHNILKGRGCPKCSNHIKKTHDDYVNEASLANPNIEVLGKYVNYSTPILHRCVIHDLEWYTSPCNVLKGHGCRKCGGDILREQKVKSHEEYVKDLKNVNSNIVVLEEYINAHVPILHRCLIDNYEWIAKPNNVLSGTGCPKCSGIMKKTHEEYIDELFLNNLNVEVLEEYINANTPILHKCKKHNIKWKICPNNVLQGNGCSECLKEKIKIKNSKTHEKYVEELKDLNPDIVVLGVYTGANTPILHKCLIDEYEWHVTPANLLFGRGCPQCKESKGERQVRLWLNNHNIDFERQYKFEDCKYINHLPFDFYLPYYNLCIEYDGKQHFEPIEHFGGKESFEKVILRDNIKNDYCKNYGISLLRIPYFKNVEEELNNFLLY